MKTLPTARVLAISFLISACATVDNDVVDDDGLGGAASTGGADSSSGGTIGAGNSTSTGGTGGSSTGGASTGGSSTGGSSTGGASTGGASTGGASTGGAGTGGVITTGDCAGMPTYDAWKSGSPMMGDQVVIQCTSAQASCAGLTTGVDILWECISSHVPNCTGQNPSGGTGVWQYVKNCE